MPPSCLMTKPGKTLAGTLFEYGRVARGDGFVRGINVRCGHCGYTSPLAVNSFSSTTGNDNEKEAAWITRKLTEMGWKVGNSPTQHRCPKCFIAVKVSAIRKSKEHDKEHDEDQTVPEVISIASHPAASGQPAQTQRPMTRDDRRIIFEKLNEVYVNDTVGYDNGWTDQRVASDLGVPRAWVKLIRDENFGDEVANDQIRETVKEAQQILAQITAVVTRYQAFGDEIKKLTSMANKVDTAISAISKSLGL